MSKASYPYPPDEFDAADDHDGPRGVHRSPRTTWSKVWPFVAVLVIFPALAFGIVTWISNSDTGLSGAISGLGATGTTEPSDGATDAAPDTATAAATEPAAPAADTPTSEAPVAPPAATPDLTAPVVVLNAANVSGLAASQTKKLEAGGFAKVTASNGSGTGVKATTVFYATEDQKVTADAVGQLLGIATVELSTTRAKDGITVVLMPGFKG